MGKQRKFINIKFKNKYYEVITIDGYSTRSRYYKNIFKFLVYNLNFCLFFNFLDKNFIINTVYLCKI